MTQHISYKKPESKLEKIYVNASLQDPIRLIIHKKIHIVDR